MKGFYKGKYVRTSFNNPQPFARCDFSGLACNHDQMVKQMEYNATGLYWTGYLVNPKFADKPQPHHLMPPVKIDPEPVMNARPGPLIIVDEIVATRIDVSGNVDITLTEAQFAFNNFVFYGALTGDVIIFVPPIFNEFNVLNSTTGGFTLSMQMSNLSNPNIILPLNQSVFIANTSFTLRVFLPN